MVVSIGDLEGQSAIAIAFPTATKINRVVDPAYLIVTADTERDGVVLAIADIGKAKAAQDRGIEGARRSQTIDAQRIVSAVLATPFAMVDKAGWNFFQLEIDNSV